MTTESPPGLRTISVWVGEGEEVLQAASTAPVVHSVSFDYQDVDQWLEVAQARKQGYIYSRNTNPTVHAFEEKVPLLESAEEATGFSSGMAAISNTLFTLLSPGDRVVSIKDIYGGTPKLFLEVLPRLQVSVALCELPTMSPLRPL